MRKKTLLYLGAAAFLYWWLRRSPPSVPTLNPATPASPAGAGNAGLVAPA